MKYIELKDVFSIKKGKKVEKVESKNDHTVRYIQIDDLRNNSQVKYCNKEENYVYVDPNDIVIAWDGANAGTVGYGLDGVIGSTLAKLEVKTEALFVPFVALYLQSKFNYFQSTATGATIPHISRNALESLEIPLISLEKQKEIFNILKKTQNIIEKREAQITALYELTQSVFLKKFRNEMKSNMVELGNVLESLKYGTSEKSTKEGYPVLRIPNIKNGEIDETDLKFCDLEGKVYESYRLEIGDILFVRSNGNQSYVGRCATVTVNQEGYVYASYLIRAKVNSSIAKPEFISYYLNAPFGRKDVLKKSRTSAGQYNINTKGLSELRIPLPRIDKQNEFVDFLVSIQNKSDNLKVSLNIMEELYNSLLQKAFKGELFQE